MMLVGCCPCAATSPESLRVVYVSPPTQPNPFPLPCCVPDSPALLFVCATGSEGALAGVASYAALRLFTKGLYRFVELLRTRS
jgi:hypothetical protein